MLDTFHLYFTVSFFVLFGLLLYRAVLQGPPAAEAYGVWLPALVLSILGMGLLWGAGRLIMGPDRSHALLALAVYVFIHHPSGGLPSAGNIAYLFTLCASVLFVTLLRILGHAAQKRRDRAIAEAIEQWRQETGPPH